MRGSTLAKALPPQSGDAREKMILDAVLRRDIAPMNWSPVKTTFTNKAGHKYTATFRVANDALRVGDAEDSFRPTVNHETAQHMADQLELVLPTAKLSDEIWRQATIRVPPMPQLRWVKDRTMARTDRMLAMSDMVDKAIAAAQLKAGNKEGLIADVGKDWITTAKLWTKPGISKHCYKGPIRSANYGWHQKGSKPYRSATARNVAVMQPIGRCHSMHHTDYSQVVRLIRRDVYVCGPGLGATGCIKMDIEQIATDPALAGLVSHEGALPAMRHPNVSPSHCPEPGGGYPGVKTLTDKKPLQCPLPKPLPKPAPPPAEPPAPALVGLATMGTGTKLLIFGGVAVATYFAARTLLPDVGTEARF